MKTTKNWGKKLMTGIFSMLLIFGFILVGCENPANDDDNVIDTPSNQKNSSITVYMEKPASWSQLYAYVWDDSSKEYSESGPGTLLTNQNPNGYYSFPADSVEDGYLNVRFSDGEFNSTLDVRGIESDTYFKSSGVYAGDSSKVTLYANETGIFGTPIFKASDKTAKTITLDWSLIPDADAYVMYDEFICFDDDDEEIPGSEYWHFQKVLPKEQTSFLDDNYGGYLEPLSDYKWKLIAVKFKDDVDFSGIPSLEDEDLAEEEFSENYTILYDFGELTIRTPEGALTAPTGLAIAEAAPTSVSLSWNSVPSADYYMVWWWDNGPDQRWKHIEAAFDTYYVDADEEFIFPGSTYKYKVEARIENGSKLEYGKLSTEVVVTTPSLSVVGFTGSSAPLFAMATAAAKTAIPKPSSPTVALNKAAGKVDVTLTFNGTKTRKFEIVGIDESRNTTVFSPPASGKKTLTKTVSVTPGKTINIAVREVPSDNYPSNKYVQSDVSSSISIVTLPKLTPVFGKAIISGKGTSTQKKVSITISGWPDGAAYHTYNVAVKTTGNKVLTPSGSWSGDTWTGTVTTSSEFYVYITPRLGSSSGAEIKAGKF